MHARRKDEAWREAQETGKGGASLEGSHLTHLKEKIKDMGVSYSSVIEPWGKCISVIKASA